MVRPIALFTGQWGDLPLEEVAERCARWGYDGLELGIGGGDHFVVERALAEPDYVAGHRALLERHGLGAGRSGRTWSARRSATPSTSAIERSSRRRCGGTAIRRASARGRPSG